MRGHFHGQAKVTELRNESSRILHQDSGVSKPGQ